MKKKTSRRAKRRNPVYKARKASMHRVPRKRSHRRRRNSNLQSMGGGGIQTAKMVLGGLVGVTLTKIVSGMIRKSVPSASSPILGVLATAISAWGIGKLAQRVDAKFGDAVAFGGYMQAGSDTLGVFAPGIGLGLGAIMPGRFAVPENVVMRGAAASLPAVAGGGVSGYNRSRVF